MFLLAAFHTHHLEANAYREFVDKQKIIVTISGIVSKWRWVPLLLARAGVGIFLIQKGLDKLRYLSHLKDILDFFGMGIPSKHLWDPFFPCVAILCGGLMLLGLLTRLAAVIFFGILAVSIFDMKLKELMGLNISTLPLSVLMVMLVGFIAMGAGSVSLDRFIFKRGASQTS